MIKNKKVWALALSLGFTVVTNLTVLANSLESRLSTVQDQAQSQKSKIAKAQQEVDSISEQLRNIQTELDAATNEYKAIKAKLGETEQKIEENEIILAKAQKSFDKACFPHTHRFQRRRQGVPAAGRRPIHRGI